MNKMRRSMLPAESVIERAVENLKSSPGKFQRLVELFAQLTYPHRFQHLVPHGRTTGDVTVKGWPDIYSFSYGNKIDVAEATHSPAWPEHLDEDVQKIEALGQNKLTGFLFVAWDNEPSLTADIKKSNQRYEKLAGHRQRLLALGIPTENINFVFKKELIYTLSQPRFARVLNDILELPCHPLPFRLVGDEPQLFGTVDRFEVFAPAKEEYEQNLVGRSSLMGVAQKRLAESHWALVLGRGATGKTVLSIQIGFDYQSRHYPAYYLDLGKTDSTVADVLDVITTHSDSGVLFIVDNVHLNERLARQAFDHWRAASIGSDLLLLGRETSFADSRGVARPLDDLRADALLLKVETGDLLGVFRRLMQRHLGLSGAVPDPPRESLQDWQLLFGGDLIAFSAAVARRIGQLRNGNWEVQSQDAADYIEENYFEKYEDARSDLLRMAALARIEVDMPKEATDLARLRPLLHEGLVHRSQYGRRSQFEYYRLVHPGIGELILKAAGYSSDAANEFVSEQLLEVAARRPFSGLLIATRLDLAGREQEGAAIYKAIIESSPEGMITLFRGELQGARFIFDRLMRFRLFSEEEIDHILSNNLPFLSKIILESGLDSITFFLNFAKESLPGLYKALNKKLIEPETVKALAKKVCTQPLDTLIGFIRTANIAPVVIAAIEESEWESARLARTFGDPQFLQTLARMLKSLGRSRLAEAPAKAIIISANPKDWRARTNHFRHLGYVLRLGRAVGPEAVQRFVTNVATPDWLANKYSEDSPSEIATTLFNIWKNYQRSLLEHFCTEELTLRLMREFRLLEYQTAKYTYQAFQLLGSSVLVSVDFEKSPVRWPQTAKLEEILHTTMLDSDQRRIGDSQILFWIGLREMIRSRSKSMTITPDVGLHVLSLWKRSPGYTQQQKTLNDWMIDWLVQGSQAGWELAVDEAAFASVSISAEKTEDPEYPTFSP